MLQEILSGLRDVLGLDAESLTIWQMGLRALIVYVAAVALVRFGESRFMGKSTAFDVILGIILGSVMSRAITGNAPFFETLGAGAALVGLHWLISVIAFRSNRFGTLVKGSERKLVEDGKVLWDAMRKSHISKNDLLEALRDNGRVYTPEEVETAYFERNGNISVIPRRDDEDKEPRVIEIRVEQGVQTVRIKLEQ